MPQQYVPPRRAPQRVITGGSDTQSIIIFILTVAVLLWGANTAGIINMANIGTGGAGYIDDSGKKSKKPKGTSSPALSRSLLEHAVRYDSRRYVWAGGHPPRKNFRGGLDCSGLINVTVLEVTNIKEDRVAEGSRRSKHWKKIKMGEAGPGDIVYRLIATHGGSTNHVAFVAENDPKKKKLRTFEAYGSKNIAPRDQVGFKNRTYENFTGALRFVR